MDEKQEAEFTYEIVNNKLRPIADRLVEKFDELHHIDVEKIQAGYGNESAAICERSGVG